MSTAETQRRGEHKKIGPEAGAGRGFVACQGFVRGGSRGNLGLALRKRAHYVRPDKALKRLAGRANFVSLCVSASPR